MKKWILAAAVALAGLAAGDARAQAPAYAQGNGSCPNGDCGQGGYAGGSQGGGGVIGPHFGAKPYWTGPAFGNSWFSSRNNITRMPTLPVYMAAPWYLYWPYDGHFQTIAPMAHGLYYPPPTYTGNPYMPGAYPGYLPGNPAPAFPVTPARP
jgi:hypothetical protein